MFKCNKNSSCVSSEKSFHCVNNYWNVCEPEPLNVWVICRRTHKRRQSEDAAKNRFATSSASALSTFVHKWWWRRSWQEEEEEEGENKKNWNRKGQRLSSLVYLYHPEGLLYIFTFVDMKFLLFRYIHIPTNTFHSGIHTNMLFTWIAVHRMLSFCNEPHLEWILWRHGTTPSIHHWHNVVMNTVAHRTSESMYGK